MVWGSIPSYLRNPTLNGIWLWGNIWEYFYVNKKPIQIKDHKVYSQLSKQMHLFGTILRRKMYPFKIITKIKKHSLIFYDLLFFKSIFTYSCLVLLKKLKYCLEVADLFFSFFPYALGKYSTSNLFFTRFCCTLKLVLTALLPIFYFSFFKRTKHEYVKILLKKSRS